MTQVLIDRATLEQLVDCPASDYERMYALKKQLRAALANAEPKKVEKREPRIDLGRYAGTYGGYTTPTKDTPSMRRTRLRRNWRDLRQLLYGRW